MADPHLNQAVAVLRSGGVIAYPTEAVWGFGCDPDNEDAVQRILDIKQRPREKGLLLVAADLQQIHSLIDDLAAEKRALLEESWPGHVTWLIPDPYDRYPKWIKGEHASIAIRVSAHPLVHDLCVEFGKPIVSTSANRASEPEIKSRSKVEQQFMDSIDYILEGDLGDADSPSSIRDLETGKIIR